MAMESGALEWRINVPDGTSRVLDPEPDSDSMVRRVCLALRSMLARLMLNVSRFLEKAWKIAVKEPKKVMHCLKVGLALSFVSLFYYMRPLYDGVGGNAMWAVMTVVVVFEYTVGATLAKCVNRAIGTFLAGALGVGVHWVANRSGEFEPIILQIAVFLLAAAATFSRFIPTIKARFDYGAMIFILTFSLVSVSGYRVDKLFEYAHHRLSTIAIGTSLCVITSMLCCPIWAGSELHHLITNNMDKLAESLHGHVTDFFGTSDNMKNEDFDKILQGYKCVLNSKATEESMANFARWEPAHGRFNFRHPWKTYLKVGASLRNSAYCIENLRGSINSETKAPDFLKKHFSKFCTSLSTKSSDVLKELGVVMKTMTKSSKIDLMVEDMKDSVQDLQNALKSLPKKEGLEEGTNTRSITVPIIEIVPLVTVASVLTEIAGRIERTVEAVNQLANEADFEVEVAKKKQRGQS